MFFAFSTSYASGQLFDKCKSCHGEDGSKKALGTSNPIKGQSKEDIIKKLNGYKNGTYGGEKKSIMAAQAKNLSEKDIHELAEYIAKLK
jgi:cytochrome c